MSSRSVAAAVLAVSLACAPRAIPVVAPARLAPDVMTARLAEADRLALRGCYLCLKEAAAAYAALLAETDDQAVATKALENNLMLALREVELRIPDSGAYEAARNYAKERRQFGQPLSAFQAIQWKLADNATRIEAARLLTYRAAHLRDRGNRTTRESSMAKLFASEAAVKAADDCVQIHGGYGFVKDYPAEKYFRDVKLLTIGEGTSEIQRLVIARQLLAQ